MQAESLRSMLPKHRTIAKKGLIEKYKYSKNLQHVYIYSPSTWKDLCYCNSMSETTYTQITSTSVSTVRKKLFCWKIAQDYKVLGYDL